ncbi:MAG TPA: YeeE/YedE thiosulfate transporter family protein [Kiritimatiellia bacterium]|jgi:uncharacterized membrane protein YedE/YeeE|nr:YeeE/YedE thiosulfate transporter family protein [Kiritimatiellia bacterium]HOM58659.1 YeeE/YedE thiosulfate transporter family protein [Kiritimatiellia bacterium]HOR98784.1 YeeE/YedE thiosulfate transporter family protein [Kiritimatiellia bacterium]HPC48925.1 YeeE/YedE thiosulfate transporter family protein [Kiritimatiellia bacterium]HPK37528.1 YeeE/YedE thiosulfate transporter family protein [Kiritimatiellia bacterium]
MISKKRERRWNPYLTGALTGLLAIASAYATTRVTGRTVYLGASTTIVRATAEIERRILPGHASRNAYLKAHPGVWDWQAGLVCGIAIGALIAALSGRTFESEWVPERWRKRFGPNVAKRAAGGFLGGAAALFGARLAGGCPSGLGLSGAMQLSVSGLVGMICFFTGGVFLIRLIGKRRDAYE